MGVEMIKDIEGKEHFVINNEDFINNDIIGNKFEDFEILQVFKKQPYGYVIKARSKTNSKIYAIKKIESNFISNINFNLFQQEFEKLENMNSPNVTKYFKYFCQNNCLYIIYEFVNNRDLYQFYEAYSKMNKPIETNTLWNIFMQGISALKYIHSKNVIHKNINLYNLFMSENKEVKLGDFRFSFLTNIPQFNNKKNFSEKTDIYELGVVFHQLCYFSFPNSEPKFTFNYPKEMIDIIKLMLNKNEKERPNADTLFNLVNKEYIKNVAKITSIDSVFRCMYSFLNFTKKMKEKSEIFNPNITPVSYNVINCIQKYNNGENRKEIAQYLNNFKNLLYDNSQLKNEMEIKPILILEFLLEKLNKETEPNCNGPSLRIQPIIFDDEKEKSLKEFETYFEKNFHSVISEFFVGFIKTKRICKFCKQGIYSFNLFPYIEFDLDLCGQDSNLENWFFTQNNHSIDLGIDHNVICRKCGCIREYYEFKQFFEMPQNFIISINRGEGFKNQKEIYFPINLDLNKGKAKVEKSSSFSEFYLTGIIKRLINKRGKEYYISIYLDPYNKSWFVSDTDNLEKINDPFQHKQGMVMALFYSAKIKLGE